MQTIPTDKKIILFDGFCNLCNGVVQFIIPRDKNDVFRFVSLQSDLGIQILNHLNLDSKNLDSIVLFEPENTYNTQSDAALEIAKHLGNYKYLNILKIIPKYIRDKIYQYIAKNRYRWFGQKESCWIPSLELKSKFL
jgi:predicted DCC family thiol-disulfide oxidoreductase YuxK